MNWNMRALRKGFSSLIKQGTGEVFSFFDIRREGGPAQDSSHLFRDRYEQVLEQFEFDRVKFIHAFSLFFE